MAGNRYQFGIFTADQPACELSKNGLRVKLQERPFQLLLVLLERPGEVISRGELRQRLWPDGTYVDFDHSISSALNKLRGALNDSATHPRYIETVGRHGYRFLADVQLLPSDGIAKREPILLPSETTATVATTRPRRYFWPVALTVVLIASLAAYFGWKKFRAPVAEPGRVIVAVLPFENLTGDPNQEYFSDGLTEEMLTQLGRLDPQHLGVIALRTTVMHYQHTPEELEQMARDLGVEYVLEGSVRRDSDQVRITANLIQMKDQTSLLSREYDRQLRSVLSLQGEIANEVADEIELALGGSHPAAVAASQPALSPSAYDAYDLYLKGRYFWNKRTSEGFQQAAQSFEQAIARQPDYARAYAGLADTYALMSSYYIGPQAELIPKARSAALKALELDPSLAEAHTSLGLITELYDWDWPTAEREFRRAIQLDPNYATGHQWYAEFLGFQGRFPEAFAESERARQLDPLSVVIASDDCAIRVFARQYDRAIAECASVLEREPSFARAHTLLIGAYLERSRFFEAVRQVRSWVKTTNDPASHSFEAYVYARAGQPQKARQEFAEFRRARLDPRVGPGPLEIWAYMSIGDNDAALAVLQRAVARRSNAITDIKVNPAYDPLRSDPRFQAILHQVHLDQ